MTMQNNHIHSGLLSSSDSPTLLPPTFQPGEYDVILGRGKQVHYNVGNINFRKLVQNYLSKYENAQTKFDKSVTLHEVVAKVQELCSNNHSQGTTGGFVRFCKEQNRWIQVDDRLAREKTSQAFRDALCDKYKSSNANKKETRKFNRRMGLEINGRSVNSISHENNTQRKLETPASKRNETTDRAPNGYSQSILSSSFDAFLPRNVSISHSEDFSLEPKKISLEQNRTFSFAWDSEVDFDGATVAPRSCFHRNLPNQQIKGFRSILSDFEQKKSQMFSMPLHPFWDSNVPLKIEQESQSVCLVSLEVLQQDALQYQCGSEQNLNKALQLPALVEPTPLLSHHTIAQPALFPSLQSLFSLEEEEMDILRRLA